MVFKNKIELRYSDSDQMGVVYHANYFTFFEQSRTLFLKELGVDYYEIESRGYIFPVRDVSCTYLSSIRLGEEVYCETVITKISKVKMDFEHVIKNVNGDIKAKGNTSIIAVRKSDFKICRMDHELQDVYNLVLKVKA